MYWYFKQCCAPRFVRQVVGNLLYAVASKSLTTKMNDVDYLVTEQYAAGKTKQCLTGLDGSKSVHMNTRTQGFSLHPLCLSVGLVLFLHDSAPLHKTNVFMQLTNRWQQHYISRFIHGILCLLFIITVCVYLYIYTHGDTIINVGTSISLEIYIYIKWLIKPQQYHDEKDHNQLEEGRHCNDILIFSVPQLILDTCRTVLRELVNPLVNQCVFMCNTLCEN